MEKLGCYTVEILKLPHISEIETVQYYIELMMTTIDPVAQASSLRCCLSL